VSNDATTDTGLTVAVTGPTGTFGAGLIPLLDSDERIAKVIGIARRPFDPSSHGWDKMRYHRGDVRDEEALTAAFEGADVVVHLAFQIMGGDSEGRRAINVDGTLNAFRASVAAKVKRFVYASSVAAYGFHPDNPVGMTEKWPTRPARQMFYAQEKAELENRLHEASTQSQDIDLYLLRPPVVLGPHAVGAKDLLPFGLGRLAGPLQTRVPRSPLPLPVPVPDMPMQFIHEDDVGSALLQCVLAGGPPGAYNIAGEGIVSTLDIARELGLWPIPLPARPAQLVARRLARVPRLPSYAQWVEAMSQPAIMDTTRAKTELHWTPRYSGLQALRATLGR
jgi:nucleoside-diphosphate-sugar epimerase